MATVNRGSGMNDEVVIDATRGGHFARVSWGAVLAGTLVALMVIVLINLLVLGIGLDSINPASEGSPLEGVGTGLGIGVLIANLLALFVGGWVAGRAANRHRGFDGVLHGILTWGLVSLLSFWLLTSAVGQLVGGVTSAVGTGLSLVGQGVSAVAPDAAEAVEDALGGVDLSLEGIREEAQQLVSQDGEGAQGEEQADQAAGAAEEAAGDAAQDPQQSAGEISTLIGQLFSEGQDVADSATREDLVTALTERTDMSQEEAEQTVDNWVQTYEDAQQALEEAQQTLEEAAQTATDAVSTAAFWAFVGLLLGAVVAAVGALTGRPKTVEARHTV
ncbi:MAG: hypothetical protein WD273_10775 [Trueperaceae bacterium]